MTLDPDTLTWTCMICKEERPDNMIQVAYRPVAGMEDQFPHTRFNVRYCKDRIGCAAEAIASGPWKGSNSSSD